MGGINEDKISKNIQREGLYMRTTDLAPKVQKKKKILDFANTLFIDPEE